MSDIFLSEGGAKSPALKFESINDSHAGKVIEVQKLEDRDPNGELKTWPNGDPKFVFVFTVATSEGIGSPPTISPSERNKPAVQFVVPKSIPASILTARLLLICNCSRHFPSCGPSVGNRDAAKTICRQSVPLLE